MATVFFKMVCIVPFYVLTTLMNQNNCSVQALDDFEEMVRIQTFKGQRLAAQNAKLFERDVFTNSQCLDTCLRTEQCASVDVKEANSKKICRINCASQEHFLEDSDSWTHISISAQYLRTVSLHL